MLLLATTKSIQQHGHSHVSSEYIDIFVNIKPQSSIIMPTLDSSVKWTYNPKIKHDGMKYLTDDDAIIEKKSKYILLLWVYDMKIVLLKHENT